MIIKRRTKKGKMRYGVRVDRPGRRQEWIGTFDTIAEARKAKALALTKKPRSAMTCDRYAEHWLESYEGRVKQSSYDTASSALKKFVKDFRGIPLANVSVMDAQAWARKNKWRVPVIVNLWNAAVDAELIERNPFAGLGRKGEGRKRIQPFTEAEVTALAGAAAQHSPSLHGLIVFLAYTGVRPGEAFALEWDDIDFERMRVRIERRVYKGTLDLPKNNRARTIVLTPPARDALLALPRDSNLVFTAKRGGRLSQTSFAWYWQSISQAVSRKVDPYELRHFAGYYLHVVKNLPDRVVAAQLGHTDGGKLVRELYGHGDVGALEEIDRAFDNVIPLRKVSNA